MIATVNIYSNKKGELNRFLSNFYNTDLDIENELKVKQAIQQLLGSHKTVVMIAHTLPIIRYADQIVVIDDKTIAETGTHEELLARHGKYFRMWNCLS